MRGFLLVEFIWMRWGKVWWFIWGIMWEIVVVFVVIIVNCDYVGI